MNVVTRAIRRSTVARGLLRPEARHVVLSSIASASTPCRAYATPAATSSLNKLDNLVQALKSAEDVSSIHHFYAILAAEAKKAKAASSTFFFSVDEDSILPVLQSLAGSGHPEDIRVIEHIISDLYPLLNIAPSKSLYTSILQSLVDGGHERQAYDLLVNIPQLPAHIIPDIEQVHIVLESCNDLSTFNRLIAYIQEKNLVPTSQTFSTIFHVRSRIANLQKEAPSVEEIAALISSCVGQGLKYDPAVVDMVYEIFAARGQYSQASSILEIYQSTLTSQKGEVETGDSTFSSGDRDEQVFAELSIQPDLEIPDRSPRTYADVQTILKQQSQRSTRSIFSLAFTNSLKSGHTEDAVQIYSEATKAGINPLNSLLSPFFKILTRDSSPEGHFNSAVAIIRQLADSVVPIPSGSSEPLPARPYGPGLFIYSGLIRALCDAPNTDYYTATISELLEEMKNRGLPTNNNIYSFAKVILDLRRTRDFVKSEDVYHQYRPLLNEYGYVAILKEYCRIAFAGDLEVPIITEFFSIVQDMRFAKVPITNIVYNTFLHAVGVTGTRIRHQDQLQRLVDSTRRVHDFLTLDASISPDATLWNQLMNTYQRLGCFAEACRLWEVMYLTGRFDQISINIMLDACGYEGNLRVARSVLTKLSKAGIKLDLRNWNTWVECLCRTGRFEEAIDVVLVKMRQNGHEPDIQSVRVLLKFARKLPAQQANEVKRLVEEGLPSLWSRLPHGLKKPR